MTVVFRASVAGLIQQIQVGPPDMIATLAMAHTAWGWIGGFDGIKHVLSRVRHPFAEEQIFKMMRDIELDSAVCHMFTSQGVVYLEEPDQEKAFGGDPHTQFWGKTICALAHECGGERAIYLFIYCLAPLIMKDDTGISGVKEALYTQLLDNCDKILNEGAARRLGQRFDEALRSAEVPVGHRQTNRDRTGFTTRKIESCMVGGLLKWLADRKQKIYFTRSSLVVRVAICLRAVGFRVGTLSTWDGKGNPPRIPDGIILVIGGNHPTDQFMMTPDDNAQPQDLPYHFHYTFRTIGSLLLNGIPPNVAENFHAETFQDMFEDVQKIVRANLQVAWKVVRVEDNEGVHAVALWGKPTERPTATAVRLASLTFKNLAKHVASCYNNIADEAHLSVILASYKETDRASSLRGEVIVHRVITASIILSMINLLAGRDFDGLRHVTSLDLSLGPFSWIEAVAQILDNGFASSLSFGQSVMLVAAAHACGTPARQSEVEGCYDARIGYRFGAYGVFPSLLFEMKPSSQAFQIRCADKFFGNFPVYQDKYIRSPQLPRLASNGLQLKDIPVSELSKPSLWLREKPWIGPPPSKAPPDSDTPIYLNIERVSQSKSPDLCMAGRVGGRLVGIMHIGSLLEVIAESHNPDNFSAKECSGHHDLNLKSALNAPPSAWIEKWGTKPFTVQYPTCISAGEDPLWALFLGGQGADFVATLGHGCFDCWSQRQDAHVYVLYREAEKKGCEQTMSNRMIGYNE